MKLRLEDLPEPLWREAEEFDRAGRREARWDLVLGALAAVGFVAALVSLFMILTAGR